MARELNGAEAAFLAEARIGHLGTLSMDLRPHVVPVCPVLDLNRVLVASAYDRKIANVRDNPSVTFCVDRYSEDWEWENGLAQVIVWGEAYVVESGPEFERDRALFYEKFPQYERVAPITEGDTAIIEIRIERVHSAGL